MFLKGNYREKADLSMERAWPASRGDAPCALSPRKGGRSVSSRTERKARPKTFVNAMQFVPAFIAERIQDSIPLQVLQMCQRILEIAENRHGLTCYVKRRLRIENAIPIGTLAQSARQKIVNFAKEEFPRRFEKLELARQKAARNMKDRGSPHYASSSAMTLVASSGGGILKPKVPFERRPSKR